jgi:hypothetical protein
MFFVFLIISFFMRNGFTVDDLGLILVAVAVLILIPFPFFIRHAAVGTFRSFYGRMPLTQSKLLQSLATLIAMEIVRDTLFRRVSPIFR